MKEFWDQRYSAEAYAYGREPNRFLKQSISAYNLKGKILLPAEGEGRNAVYAAKQGLEVFAFDISKAGKSKALRLADIEKVNIHYELGDFFELDLIQEQFDVAALIFAHFPVPVLSAYHQKIASMIKPKGYVVLEGFSENHLELRANNPKVGGPNKLEMLFSVEGIKKDFPHFEIIQLEEVEVELQEGAFHNGIGKVIRFIGRKPA